MPKSIAPKRPLPIASASVHTFAGLRYQSVNGAEAGEACSKGLAGTAVTWAALMTPRSRTVHERKRLAKTAGMRRLQNPRERGVTEVHTPSAFLDNVRSFPIVLITP